MVYQRLLVLIKGTFAAAVALFFVPIGGIIK
jgi:hypothetical protein